MKYFRDVDKNNIVRKSDEGMFLEYTFKGAKGWLKTEPDSSYEREYWLGEGNTCLFDLDESEALAEILCWGEFLCEKHILSADECFISLHTVYVSLKNVKEMFVYDTKKKEWYRQSVSDLIEADDMFDANCFTVITNEEAVAEIYNEQTEEPQKQKSAADKTADFKPANNIIEQMVDGIVGKQSETTTEREKGIRQHLAGRALEYLMFMDDDDE